MSIVGHVLNFSLWLFGIYSLLQLGYVKAAPWRHRMLNREAMHQAILTDDTDRYIQTQDHELWPGRRFDHVNCAICGPGPLKQGMVPSAYQHPFFNKVTETHADSYGTWQVEELKASLAEYATIVSSKVIEDGDYTGKHTLMLDMDYPVTLMESTTAGHHHLYADRLMTWRQYRAVLKAMANAGLIETGYYQAACRQQATMLRPPWVKKELSPRRAVPSAPKPNRDTRWSRRGIRRGRR